MRVVAARFPERSQAAAALDLLRRQLRPPDVAVAPLAWSDEPTATDAVLAGRFPDELVPAAVELVERSGGEIVADIDESWIGLGSSTSGATSGAPTERRRQTYRFD
jgi:hypothetical protein